MNRCARLSALLVCLVTGVGSSAESPVAVGPRGGGNVLLIVADDVGVETLSPYREGRCSATVRSCETSLDCPAGERCAPDDPATPTLDALASRGIVYRNAWAAPFCSPSRALMLTGRYGFRNSVVAINRRLPECELTIPEVLDAQFPPLDYAHAAFGKWHLAGRNADYPGCAGQAVCPSRLLHPNASGFSHFEGSIANFGGGGAIRACSASLDPCLADADCASGETCSLATCEQHADVYCDADGDCPSGACRNRIPADYYRWVQTTNGTQRILYPDPHADPPVTLDDVFATTVHVDAALRWIGDRDRQPWFVYFNFNAAHLPWVVPPWRLVSESMRQRLADLDLLPGDACPDAAADPRSRACYEAMIESLDTELGRLVAAVPPNTSIVFAGDNGTPMAWPPFEPGRQKGTLYEGGVNVPLIVVPAWSVPGSGVESSALVDATDLFRLVLDFAGADPPSDRTIDGVRMPGVFAPASGEREFAYADSEDGRAIRDGRFKLISRSSFGFPTQELYDLVADPFERVDLHRDPALGDRRAKLNLTMEALAATADRCD